MNTMVPTPGADRTVYTPRKARGSSNRHAFVSGEGRPLRVASCMGIRAFGIWSPANTSCLSRFVHHRSFFRCLSSSFDSAARARGPMRTSPAENRASLATLPALDGLPEIGMDVERPHDAFRSLSDATEAFVMLDGRPEGRVHHLPR